MEKGFKEKILSLRKDGKTYNEIMNELHCAKSTISYHCKIAGLENDNILDSPSKEEIKKFQELYDKSGSCEKVAKITFFNFIIFRFYQHD